MHSKLFVLNSLIVALENPDYTHNIVCTHCGCEETQCED